MSAFIIYGLLVLGAVLGWGLCCIMTVGKYSDMQSELVALQQENHLLKTAQGGDANV